MWFIPTVAVLGAIVLATVLGGVAVPPSSWMSNLLFASEAEGARGMLQAVAGSVITVTSLVFSLTVVTLQLASSQFSPRLLRTFVSDRGNQVVLAIFLATFAYSLTVLRTIRDGTTGGEPFVPQLAVTIAFLLALASVGALVYFIHHITQEIQVDTMMRDVERETRRTIDVVYPNHYADEPHEPQVPDVPEGAACIPARHSGFVQSVDVDHLAAVARDHDVKIRLHAGLGQAVAEQAPFVWIWPSDGARPAGDVSGELRAAIFDAVDIGRERTPESDVAIGLRQLVDVAVKAMSPAVNDPTTAVHAIGHATALLCVLAPRQLGDLLGRDREGTVRVGVERPDFDGYLDLACGQLRRYAAGEVQVMRALLWMLREVAGGAPEHRRPSIKTQMELICVAAERELTQDHDRNQVRKSAAAVERALAGDQRP